MSEVSTISASARKEGTSAHLTSGQILVQRLRLLSALVLSGVVFWYFGWWVARPLDPGGAIALLMVEQGVITMAQLLGLAVLVSGLAVAICGGDSAERGPLAVAVGLATLASRGAQMDMLVLHLMTTVPPEEIKADPGQVYPVSVFIAETWLWLALIGVGFVVGRWVQSWFVPNLQAPDRRGEQEPDHAMDIRQGVGTVAVGSFTAWVIVSYSVSVVNAQIEKGQIYFSLISAFLVAGLLAHWFFQNASRVWMLLSVALVATAAYWYASPNPEMVIEASAAGAYITLAPIARPLPIEFAALGAIGILLEGDVSAMLWAMFGLSPREE